MRTELIEFECGNDILREILAVPGDDHDLERPDFFEQWFPKAVDFLS